MINKRQRLDGISILRLFATLGIMLYHVGFGHYYFQSLRLALGANLFLCISAFLFMHTTQTKTASYFLKNRLIRIVPLYAILTVLTYIAVRFLGDIYNGGVDITELINSLFFIPYFRDSMKSGNVIRPLVGPAWTLYYDVWFTFIFACSMKLSKKWRGLIASVACIIVYCVGWLLPNEFAVAVFLRNIFWFDFVVGIIAFYIWRYVSQRITPRVVRLSGIVAILSFLSLYLDLGTRALRPIESLLLLISTLLFTANKSVPTFVSKFAKLSYSFYLIHYYVIIIVGRIVDFTVFSAETIFGTAAVFIVTLLISICSYIIIETKLCSLLKHWILEKQLKKENKEPVS